MCLCTTSHHNSSDNISRQPTTTTMNMNMNMNTSTMSPPTSSTTTRSSSSPVVIKNIGSSDDDGMISWNDITIQEDDTCYLLSIDMPNVNGKDVTITLEKNIITISGYRRCCASATTRSSSTSTRSLSFSSTSTENSSTSTSTSSSSSSSEEQYQEEDYEQEQQQQERAYHKRQRLVNRRLEIDTTVIDIERAIANTWNGSLTLYAPKR